MARNPNGPEGKPQQQPVKESFIGIPLKGWAAFAVSLIVVCAALAHYSIRIYGDWQEQKKTAHDATDEASKAKADSNKVKSVNDVTSKTTDLIVRERQKHANDHSGHQFMLHSDNGGVTLATYFESDGCIAVKRPGAKLPYLDHPLDDVQWLVGPSVLQNEATPYPTTASLDAGDEAFLARSVKGMLPSPELLRVGARNPKGSNAARFLTAQAGCLNPHPWPFQSWWGPANGCFAPLYRRWNDGCTHYQIYNSCTGQWDPTIFWTTCNPNHHP